MVGLSHSWSLTLDPLVHAAYVNLALAIKVAVEMSHTRGDGIEDGAKKVSDLLGGYDHIRERNTDDLESIFRREANGY